MKGSETQTFREKILNSIGEKPGITTKKLAVKLDVQQSNLYYHLKQLSKAEKVSVEIKMTVNGINEKYYYPVGKGGRQERVEPHVKPSVSDVKISHGPEPDTTVSKDTEELIEKDDEVKTDTKVEIEPELQTEEVKEEDPQTQLIKDLLSMEKGESTKEIQVEEVSDKKDEDILDVEKKEKKTSPLSEGEEKAEQFTPKIHTDVKEGEEEAADQILDVKEDPPAKTDDTAQSLKDILTGKKPEIVTEEPQPETLDKEETVEDEEEYDEVMIENIPFMVPKSSNSLDDLVSKTHTKGGKIIDLETQAKVFEYLKSNYSFEVPVNEDIEIFGMEGTEESDEDLGLTEDDEEDSDRKLDVKNKSNPIVNVLKKLSFNSYELSIQQAGKSISILFTQRVGDKLKLIYNEKLTIPMHEHMAVLGSKIDSIIKKFNIKQSRVKVSVESDHVFTQKLEFEAPDIKKKEIEELIKIKIQRELQIDPNNSYFNFNIKKLNGSPSVIVHIADSDPINELIEFFKERGLNIAYLSSLSTVCNQLVEKTYGISIQPRLLVYLGYSRSNLLVIKDGNIVMNTRIGASIEDLIKRMKGSVYGGSKSQQISEQDILELIETSAFADEDNEMFKRLKIPYQTFRQLFEDFIMSVGNDMILAIRQFQKVQSTNIKEGFLVSYLDTHDMLIEALSKQLKFELNEIAIEKFFNAQDQEQVRDYFGILVGLSVADKRELNLLPKNIREKAVYIGRTKLLAGTSSGVVAILVSLLIYSFSTLKISEAKLESAQQNFNTNKAVYTNSINYQTKSALLDFIDVDLTNKLTSTRNLIRFLAYLGNEMPNGIKINQLQSIPGDELNTGKESLYPNRFVISGFITSDLSNALIILEGMKNKLAKAKNINLISFENTDFMMDVKEKLPKQYFKIVCELK